MEDVFRVVEKNQDVYIKWLQELCRIPSVAAQNRGMDKAAGKVKEWIEEFCQGQSKLVATDGFPVVYGEVQGEVDKTLLFYNHYDVQPEDPIDLWTHPPFSAEIHDGVLYARGVADNKGNLIARMAAVHALQEARGKLPINVKFVFEGEEEIGSVNLPAFCRNHQDLLAADACIWEFGYKNADGRQQVSLGVKGMVYIELICRGASTDLHSANAAIIENPAWRLVQALHSMRDDSGYVKIEGFYDEVEAPIESDRVLLDQLIYSEEETKEKLGIDRFVNGVSGHELKEQLIFSPTCNICGLTSGYQGEGTKTVLPNVASVKLDFRLVPNQDPHTILGKIRDHLDKNGYSDIELKEFGLEHPARTNPQDAIAQSVVMMTEKVLGQKPTVMPMSPGTGPMYEVCQQFDIPAVSVGVGHFSSNNHAPNENIVVQDFIDGIKLMAAVIDDFSQRGGDEL